MCHCSWLAEKLFEVRHISQLWERFVVDIDEQSCTCRKWSISGIPCCHSLSTMKFLNLNGEDLIPSVFRKSTYEEIYTSIIFPINGHSLLETTPYPDVLPPSKRILLGRPKKKRRLEQWEIRRDETRLRKGGLRKTCRICKQIGHNRRACPKVIEIHLAQLREAQQQRPTEASQQPTPTDASEPQTQPSQHPPPAQPSQ